LISSPSTIPATSYNLHHRRPIAPKSPGRQAHPMLNVQHRVWRPEQLKAHDNHDGGYIYRHIISWRLCVGDLRVCRVPFAPVRQPACLI